MTDQPTNTEKKPRKPRKPSLYVLQKQHDYGGGNDSKPSTLLWADKGCFPTPKQAWAHVQKVSISGRLRVACIRGERTAVSQQSIVFAD